MLDGIDLAVPAGTVLAVLGANGAGKSTLLRIIGTTLLPDSGSVRVDGVDVVAQPREVRRRLGLVLGEDRSWYYRLTGRQNLEFFAALYGVARPAPRIEELLARVGLDAAGDRPVSDYSTGMRARLGLARGLLHEPVALLLDEPTRSIDPLATRDFGGLVRATAGDQAVIFATHDLHEAASVADRVAVLGGGRLTMVESGRPDAASLERTLRDRTAGTAPTA